MLRMIIVIIAFMLPSISCGSNAAQKGTLVGGPCTYEKIGGVCTATETDSEGKVHFTFAGMVGGQNVELKDNKASGKMTAGEKVSCTIDFITSGTCTPCLFSIGECGKEAWDAFRSYKK